MARRQITDPLSIDAAELPVLTVQEYAFVQALLAGKSPQHAFREAFPDSKAAPTSIPVMATQIKHRPRIRAWLARLKAAMAHRGAWTLQDHIERLDELQAVALASGNVGAAVQAEALKAKALGYHAERRGGEAAIPIGDMLAKVKDVIGEGYEQTELYVRLIRRRDLYAAQDKTIMNDQAMIEPDGAT